MVRRDGPALPIVLPGRSRGTWGAGSARFANRFARGFGEAAGEAFPWWMIRSVDLRSGGGLGLVAGAEKAGLDRLGVGRAEVGEVGQQVGVGYEACRGHLAVAQPGPPVAVDVLDGPAAVRVEGGLGSVVAQDVGQHLQGSDP